RPRFTYYGFRYVQVEGAEPLPDGPEDTGTVTDLADAAEPGMDQALRRGAALASGRAVLLGIEGQMIYPDVAEKGSFECSDHMINRIHEIINWAVLSNMKSVFTDCPHREKLGWLEQLHLMGPSVMYNYDVETIFSKVMEDIRDAQQPSGMIPTTAPEYIVFQPPWDMFRDSVSWGAAYIISNWDLLLQYGNPGSMRTHYPGMKRYAEYMASKMVDGLIMHGLGDWYDVGEDGPGFAQNTPVPLVETAIFYQMAAILEEMAGIL
ncbi:alpha-L-rhamnosidase, partial [Paenibacillus sepulcri]|nr:alpha-L-rhamnosidase [Paenibacillus sepulcri]